MDRHNLRTLFLACDVNKSGLIEYEDFTVVCRELNVPDDEIMSLFSKFDADAEGCINYQTFLSRFQEVSETLDLASFGGSVQAQAGPVDDFQSMMDGAGAVFSERLQQKLGGLYQALSSSEFQLLKQYEDVIRTFLSESMDHKLESQQLESHLKRTEEMNSSQLAELEDDIQQQLAQVEERVRREERRKMEEVISALQRKHENEVTDLHAAVDRLLKCREETERNISREDVDKLRNQMSELTQDNEQLRRSLLTAQTNIAIMQVEMDKLKNMYTDQRLQHARESDDLKEMVMEYQSYASHVEVLQEMNKKLYDSNDGLRSALTQDVMSPKKNKDVMSPQKTMDVMSLQKSMGVMSPQKTMGVMSPQKSMDVMSPQKTMGVMSPQKSMDVMSPQKTMDVMSLQKSMDVMSPKRKLSSMDESPVRRMKPLRQSTLNRSEQDVSAPDKTEYSHVASWADKYLDSGVALPMDSADNSASDYDSDDTMDSVETVHRSYSYVPSEIEISEVKPELTSRRTSSIASSVRRRLSAFPTKQTEADTVVETDGPAPMYRLVLAGDAGSGKSSFLLRLSINEFRADMQATLGVDFQMKKMLVDGEQTNLQIWDTAGQERFRSIARSYFRKAHGVLLLYDVTSESSFLSVREWVDQIQDSSDGQIPMCLIGNKVDMRAELPEGRCVSTVEGEKLARAYNALFCETSAKEGTNVVETVLHLAREVKKNRKQRRLTEPQVKLSLTNPKKTRNCCRS